jgi:glycine dehydrogenase subunit 1
VEGSLPDLLTHLLDKGYHAGLHLGRWYPGLDECLSVAVTEKRTRGEIDGLVEALSAYQVGARNGAHASREVHSVLENR